MADKTADGVDIVAGMIVWQHSYCWGHIVEKVEANPKDYRYSPDLYYSTRKGALLAYLAAIEVERDKVLKMLMEERLKKFQICADAFRARLAMLESNPDFRIDRAGGDVSCHCGLKYYDHPAHPIFGYMTVLCDGSLVKL
jgi:hypothetical protein